MKDIVVPPLVPVTTEGSLADLPARNGQERPGTRRSPARGHPVGRRHRGGVPRRGPRGRQGPGRGRRRGRRPGRADVARPATSGRWSTTRSGSPARSPCRSTRPPRPSRSSWILADSGARAVVVETAAPRATGRRGRAATCPALARRLADRRRRPRRAGRRRRRRRRRRARRAPAHGVRPRRPRHDHLHLRHHRPAQGLHAHARQLHVELAVNAVERARRRRSAPRAPRRCCSCRWPTSSPGSSRCCASQAGARLGHTADIKNLLDDLGGSSRRSSSPCPGSSRRSSTPPSRRPPPTAGAGSSTGPPSTAIAYSRALDDGRPGPAAARPSTRCSTGWSTPSCAPRSAAGAVRRLRRRAARRPARPLLPRHRPHRPRGLRPDRDHRRGAP